MAGADRDRKRPRFHGHLGASKDVITHLPGVILNSVRTSTIYRDEQEQKGDGRGLCQKRWCPPDPKAWSCIVARASYLSRKKNVCVCVLIMHL